MAQNTAPIFTLTPDVSSNNSTGATTVLTAATGDYTGISANHVLVHTAGANGSFVERLRFVAVGTNAASVARVYLNNGSTAGTATNNEPFGQISLPATTASNSAATVDVDYPLNIRLPSGWRIYVGLGSAVAAGWSCVAVAGQY